MNPFSKNHAGSVSALGEVALITAIRRWLGAASPPPPAGIGDDCAVLPPSRRPQLVTVDPVIFGRHFDASLPPRAVAAKLLKRNLSDLAAMGGRPVAGLVALTLDARTSLRWVEAFYRGLASLALEYKVPVVGGDVAEAPGIVAASLTLVGEAAAARVLRRMGARSGDGIYVTGTLGGSLARGHHYRFVPRLAEGAWLARQPEVRAMIDVSDGLAKDLRALTPPGCEPAIDPAAVPRRAGADLRAAFVDGEDYELLFVLARGADHDGFMRRWRRAFPRVRLSRLGRFVPAGRLPPTAMSLAGLRGYEHLRR